MEAPHADWQRRAAHPEAGTYVRSTKSRHDDQHPYWYHQYPIRIISTLIGKIGTLNSREVCKRVRSSERAAQNSPLPHEWGDRRGQEWSHFGESKYDPFLGIENAKRGMARKWMAIIDGIIASVMDHLLQRREKEFQRLQVRSVRSVGSGARMAACAARLLTTAPPALPTLMQLAARHAAPPPTCAVPQRRLFASPQDCGGGQRACWPRSGRQADGSTDRSMQRQQRASERTFGSAGLGRSRVLPQKVY